jgi:hypothetical protein
MNRQECIKESTLSNPTQRPNFDRGSIETSEQQDFRKQRVLVSIADEREVFSD